MNHSQSVTDRAAYYFAADGDDEPTLWRRNIREPIAVMRRCDNTEVFDLLTEILGSARTRIRGRWQCLMCGRSGGELTENGCPTHGGGALGYRVERTTDART